MSQIVHPPNAVTFMRDSHSDRSSSSMFRFVQVWAPPQRGHIHEELTTRQVDHTQFGAPPPNTFTMDAHLERESVYM